MRFLALSICVGVAVDVVAGCVPALASAPLLMAICLALMASTSLSFWRLFSSVLARAAAMAASSLARAEAAADAGVAEVVAAGVAGFTDAVVAGLLATLAVDAGLVFVVVATGLLATFVVVVGLVLAVAAGFAGAVAAGLAATVVAGLLGAGAVLAAVVVAGARTTGAGVGAARTTGAGAARTTGAGACRTTGAGAARTTGAGAGAGAELVVFLVSAKACCDNTSAISSTLARAIPVSNVMTFPQRNWCRKSNGAWRRIVLGNSLQVTRQL